MGHTVRFIERTRALATQPSPNGSRRPVAVIVQVSDETMQETLREEPSKMHRQARLGHPSSQGKPMSTIVPYTDLLNTYPCTLGRHLDPTHSRTVVREELSPQHRSILYL